MISPGRELDAFVAEKVMGYAHNLGKGASGWDRVLTAAEIRSIHESGGDIPRYSSDIACAWEVVEKFRSAATDVSIVTTSNHSGFVVALNDGERPVTARADTAPHAICLAALKALGCEIAR